MEQTYDTAEVDIGFHPDGYRIDKTASSVNWYTKWQILSGTLWCDPEPVRFDSLPKKGWVKINRLDWDRMDIKADITGIILLGSDAYHEDCVCKR